MIVHFGLQLDGMQPHRAVTGLGRVHAGPLRLLDLLETQLGLPGVAARPAEAVLAYRSCLAELDGPERFYHGSFAVDPLGVARTLCAWRSQWYAAGWNGRFEQAVSVRLRDMALVEQLAATRVPLGTGQRAQRARAALAAGLRVPIERILLHDPLDALPAAWRDLLASFEWELAPGAHPRPCATPGTDLRAVQDAVASATGNVMERPGRRVHLARDGSFVILRGGSRDLTAQAVAELVRGEGVERCVVIAERDGIILDNALARVGLARAGYQHRSRFRAVTQVLKLCLGLVWRPVSPQLLLQFLVHPVGPLPVAWRTRLAAAVARAPGMGGPEWRAALADIALRAATPSEAAPGAAPEHEIAAWLDCERYEAVPGAPLTALAARTRQVATWLATAPGLYHEAGTAALYGAALAQAEALIRAFEALAAQGLEHLPRLECERLIDEVGGHAPDPSVFAEVDHVAAATTPAAITETWDHVFWWDLRGGTSEARPPWSVAEFEELRAAGVNIPSPAERIEQRAREWQRPLLNARRRAILVVHEHEEAAHPLLALLEGLVDGHAQCRLEDELLGMDLAPSRTVAIPTEALAPRPLPVARRWWRLPRGTVLPPRPIESYTSLERLIERPHQWVLEYAARLRPGRASDLPRGNLLYGQLAHRMLECFFETHTNWAQLGAANTQAWAARTLPALIAEQAAQLDTPGAGVERARVLATLEQALERLLEHLRDAGVATVCAEQFGRAPFDHGELQGTIDLLLALRDGREIVLDVKWGRSHDRARSLTERRALQLASYAYLRRAATGRWPHYGYFIVTSGEVLAPDASVFPEARVCGGGDVALEEWWKQVAATVHWRRAQLADGLIEVNARGTMPTAESEPPAGAYSPAAAPSPYYDVPALTGWEPGA